MGRSMSGKLKHTTIAISFETAAQLQRIMMTQAIETGKRPTYDKIISRLLATADELATTRHQLEKARHSLAQDMMWHPVQKNENHGEANDRSKLNA